jgi:Resolvase, N terminal domain
MPTYGYARVSTIDQDLSLQRRTLKAAGCDVIRAEKASGTRRNGRTELQVLLDFLRPGDTLVVTRVDRLARSIRDLQDIVHELRERGVTLKAPSSRSIPAQRPARPSSTCSVCSPSLRPISVESVSSKASPWLRQEAPIKAASGQSMRSASADSDHRAWALPRSPVS